MHPLKSETLSSVVSRIRAAERQHPAIPPTTGISIPVFSDSPWLHPNKRPRSFTQCLLLWARRSVRRRKPQRLTPNGLRPLGKAPYISAERFRVNNNIVALYPSYSLALKLPRENGRRSADSLENEYNTLLRLSKMGFANASTPERFDKSHAALWLHYIPETPYKEADEQRLAKLTRCLLELYETSGVSQARIGDFPRLQSLGHEAKRKLEDGGADAEYAREMVEAIKDIRVLCSRIHGDPALVNTIASREGIIVTDWELSTQGPIEWDITNLIDKHPDQPRIFESYKKWAANKNDSYKPDVAAVAISYLKSLDALERFDAISKESGWADGVRRRKLYEYIKIIEKRQSFLRSLMEKPDSAAYAGFFEREKMRRTSV